MSRYSSRYDKDGVPISNFGGMTEPMPSISFGAFEAPAPRPTASLDDADLLYENLRYSGLSHKEARAEVARVMGV